jgi:hypothetical protein
VVREEVPPEVVDGLGGGVVVPLVRVGPGNAQP